MKVKELISLLRKEDVETDVVLCIKTINDDDADVDPGEESTDIFEINSIDSLTTEDNEEVLALTADLTEQGEDEENEDDDDDKPKGKKKVVEEEDIDDE